MSDQPAPDSDATEDAQPEAWSANGTHDFGDPVTEPDVESAAADAESEAAVEAQAEVAADAGATERIAAAAGDPGTFLNELVQAMRTTVAAERSRITAEADRRREEHLAAIQTRREPEAQRIRDLAEDDLKAIDGWAEAERERIRAERERRAEALATDLKTSLAEHGTRVDREVERVEAAIAGYRSEVEAFFGRLDGESDPVAIAQEAGNRPSFPDLEAVAQSPDPLVAEADTAAADEAETPEATDAPAPVAVMDPDRVSKLAASFAAWTASTPVAPVSTESAVETASTESNAPIEARASVAVGRWGHDNGPGTVLHAVPSARPLSWLRRGSDTTDGRD
jgi:hypothetical protein